MQDYSAEGGWLLTEDLIPKAKTKEKKLSKNTQYQRYDIFFRGSNGCYWLFLATINSFNLAQMKIITIIEYVFFNAYYT